MRRSVVTALASALFVVLAPALRAGTYTVKDDGTGDFDDLPTALVSVPVGSTLLLTGSFAGEIRITQSVRIVGGTIYADPYWQPIVHVIGADWVILEGITIPDEDDSSHNFAGPGIKVEDVRYFAMHDCVVNGHGFDPQSTGTCDVPFPSGFDALHLERVGYARIVGCELYGGTGTLQYAFGDPGYCDLDVVVGGVGGAGLRIEQSFVHCEDTLAVGADGGDADWNDWVGRGLPPVSLTGGDGGAGVVGDVFADGCTFVGGKAGTFVYSAGTDWGIGSDGVDGADVVGSETTLVLPQRLVVSDLVIGQPATLDGSGFTSSSIALLFLAADVDPPLAIRQGAWLLEFPVLFLGATATDGAGGFSIAGTIPNDPGLIATLSFVQAADAKGISEAQELIVTN